MSGKLGKFDYHVYLMKSSELMGEQRFLFETIYGMAINRVASGHGENELYTLVEVENARGRVSEVRRRMDVAGDFLMFHNSENGSLLEGKAAELYKERYGVNVDDYDQRRRLANEFAQTVNRLDDDSLRVFLGWMSVDGQWFDNAMKSMFPEVELRG